MIKFKMALTLGILLILVTGSAGLAGSPPLPASFYGTVKLDGVNVTAGTPVSAWINGVQYAEALTFFADGDSVYDIDVSGDDPDTPDVEGGREGETIVFQVAGYEAAQTARWHSGTDRRLDLTATTGPDLVVTGVDTDAVTVDPQVLIVSGPITATIKNQGNTDIATAASFEVTFFEDDDNDGAYTTGTDRVLGRATHTGGLAAGAEAQVQTLVAGEVLFRDNLIYAFVDSENVVGEQDETNNLNHSGARCASRPPGPYTWEHEILVATQALVELPDLAVDASGRPHISLVYDAPPGVAGRVAYAYYDGALWHLEHLETAPPKCCGNNAAAIALGPDGQPRIAYVYNVSSGGPHTLRYATRTGPDSWSYETLHSRRMAFVSLAVDSAGNAHIADPSDPTGAGAEVWLFYHTNAGGTWSSIVVDDVLDSPHRPVIRLDGSERPHIVYRRRGEVVHAYYDGTDWQREVVDPGAYLDPSLAFDSKGMPHVAYRSLTRRKITYASRLPTGWTSEIVDPDGGDTLRWLHPSLAFDAADRPHIVADDLGVMRHAWRDASGWHAEVVLPSDPGVREGFIAFDSAGRMHVVHRHFNRVDYVLGTPPAPTAAPDLTASRLLMDLAALPASMELTARIGNGGAAQAGAGVSVAFYDGDPASGGVLIGTPQTTQALNRGEYQDVTLTWNSPSPGTHDIYVVADDDGAGASTQNGCGETNNTHHQPVDTNVIGPDLVIPAMERSGTTTDPQALTIVGDLSVQLQNQGNQDVTTPFQVTLFEDADGNAAFTDGVDNVLGRRTYFGTLAVGQSVWLPVAVSGNVLFRDNLIYAFADSQNVIAELDEANNYNQTGAFCQYLPAGGAPLAAPDVTASYIRGDVGNYPASVTFTARVGNGGATPVPAGLPVAFWDGDPNDGGTLLGVAQTTQPLNPGDYEDITFTWTSPELGLQTIYVVADDDGTDAAPLTPQLWGELYSPPLRLGRPRGLGAEGASPSKGSGQAGAGIGTHNECDETNNTHWQPYITGPEGPDLVVPLVDASGTNTDPRTPTIQGTVTAQIHNQGSTAATADFEVTFFEDLDGDAGYTAGTDTVLGQTTYTGGLAPGATANVETSVSGQVRFVGSSLWAFADSADVIAELDETNNLNQTATECRVGAAPAPDLTLSYLRGEPADLSTGAGEQGSKGAEEQRSRGAEEQRGRGAEGQRGRGAEGQGSRGAEENSPRHHGASAPLHPGTRAPLHPSPVDLTVRVANAGEAPVAPGIGVDFYLGDPAAGGTLLSTTTTSRALAPAEYEDVTVRWTDATTGTHTIFVTVEAAGECDEGDNTYQQRVDILDIPLVERWNLISGWVNPFNTDIGVVQRPITGTYVVIMGFDGGARSYYPDLPAAVNTLKSIDAEHGYWIKVSNQLSVNSNQLSVNSNQLSVISDESSTITDDWPLITDHWSLITDHWSAVAPLRLVGTAFDENRPIELDAGWNLVSFLSRNEMGVGEGLRSIEGEYTAVLGFDQGALSYYPHLEPLFNTLWALQPLHGYWLKMTQASMLRYPRTQAGEPGLAGLMGGDPDARRRAQLARQAELATGVQTTNTWVNFYGPAHLADGKPAPAGALIQVFDADGVPCGAGIVTQPGLYGLLACYGDDPTTPEDEGASPGDVLTFTIDGQPVVVNGEAVWTVHGDLRPVALGPVPVWRVWLPVVSR